MKVHVLALLGLLSAQATPVQPDIARLQAEFAAAVARVPRFEPDRFPALPPTVRQAFTDINCRVPQLGLTSGLASVIQGEFAAAGQRDWAALCSDGSASTVRVVWGGPARCEGGVGTGDDLQAMTVITTGVIGFDRRITPAAMTLINFYLKRNGETLPERAAHDAIEDGSEKMSLLYYCHAGRWLTLAGGNH